MNLQTYLRIKYANRTVDVNFSRNDMNQMIEDAKVSNPDKAPEYDAVGAAFNSGCRTRTPKYVYDPTTGRNTRLTPAQFRQLGTALRQAQNAISINNNKPAVIDANSQSTTTAAPTADGTVDATGRVLRKIRI